MMAILSIARRFRDYLTEFTFATNFPELYKDSHTPADKKIPPKIMKIEENMGSHAGLSDPAIVFEMQLW